MTDQGTRPQETPLPGRRYHRTHRDISVAVSRPACRCLVIESWYDEEEGTSQYELLSVLAVRSTVRRVYTKITEEGEPGGTSGVRLFAFARGAAGVAFLAGPGADRLGSGGRGPALTKKSPPQQGRDPWLTTKCNLRFLLNEDRSYAAEI
jgi:hypothetical protein